MKLNGPWQNNCTYSFSSSIVRAKRARNKSIFTDCPDVSIGVTWSVIRIDGQQQIRTIYQGRIRGIFHRPENAKVSGFFKKNPERPPPDWKMSGFPDKSGGLEALSGFVVLFYIVSILPQSIRKTRNTQINQFIYLMSD